MPDYPPPEACPGTPVTITLPEGMMLARVHSDGFAATAFNSTPAPTADRGGRFDSLDGDYGCLYAGEDGRVAVAEALLRDIPFPEGGPRQLPFRAIRNKSLSWLETTTALSLVSLRGADLGQVGQDVWLTKCEAVEYVRTRRWAAAIRRWAPDAAGFVWRSRRDEERLAYVFFEDRIPEDPFVAVGDPTPIDEGVGLVRVRKALLRHNVVLTRD